MCTVQKWHSNYFFLSKFLFRFLFSAEVTKNKLFYFLGEIAEKTHHQNSHRRSRSLRLLVAKSSGKTIRDACLRMTFLSHAAPRPPRLLALAPSPPVVVAVVVVVV